MSSALSPIKKKFALAVILLSVLSCGKSFKSDAESTAGTVKIQIMAPSSEPSTSSESLPYLFATVELFNVYDLVSLSGRYAQFYTKAVRTDDELFGKQPRGQFLKNKDGVFIPKNYLSLQLATLYYHTQNLIKLEHSLSIEEPRKGPLKIVLETPVMNSSQNENNAFYEGSLDAIIFLKYSEGSLPLSLNGGVFAHEYFHSIFDRLVLKKLRNHELFTVPISINKINSKITLKDIKNIKLAPSPFNLSPENVKWYYTLLLKGFNEGLADYWGWSYVNDSSFIGHSLPQAHRTRQLDLPSQNMDSLRLLSDAEMLSIVFQSSVQSSESKGDKLELINAFSYLLGSRVALFFKTFSELIQTERKLSSEDTQKTMNQLVLNFVKSLSNRLPELSLANDSSNLVNLYSLIYQFMASESWPNKLECDFVRLFLENDVKLANKLECTLSKEAFQLRAKAVL